jgi:hypothetical protein
LLYEDILLHHFPDKVAEYESAVKAYEEGDWSAVENLANDEEESSSDDELN